MNAPSSGRVIGACLRRDLITARSYRLPFAMEGLSSAFTLALFFYLGRLVDSGEFGLPGGYFAFAIVGIAVLRMIQSALGAFTATMRAEQTTGTLEALLSSAASPSQVILGSSGYVLLRSGLTSALMLALAVPLGLDIQMTVPSAGGFVVGLVALVALFAAVGIGVAGFTIVFKQAGPLTTLITSGLSLLGGVYFPVELLPGPVQAVAEALPFTWGLDVVRATLLEGRVPMDRLALVVGSSVVLLPLSLWMFGWAVGRAKRTGSLGTY